jgi:TolA-binding protein
MKVIDFHPDELLDREIQGKLSSNDRRRLYEHLDHCAQCQLERQLRCDFEAELGSRQDETNLQSFVTGALRAARSSASRRPPRHNVVNAWRRRFVFLLAATMVLAAGLAAAQVELAGRAWQAAREKIVFLFRVPEPPLLPTGAAPAATVPSRAQEATDVAPQVPFLVERADEPKDRAPVNDRPAAATEPRAPGVAVHRAAVERTRVALPEQVEPQPPPIEETNATPRDSASALFEDASAARRSGRMLEAAALYRDLEARFPASPEARLSMAVVARMELDLGEAAAAASGFAAYLATGDRALREEAMAGRAIALGRLGRADAEAAAWRDLLRAYPGSSYAKVARARLGQDLP